MNCCKALVLYSESVALPQVTHVTFDDAFSRKSENNFSCVIFSFISKKLQKRGLRLRIGAAFYFSFLSKVRIKNNDMCKFVVKLFCTFSSYQHVNKFAHVLARNTHQAKISFLDVNCETKVFYFFMCLFASSTTYS